MINRAGWGIALSALLATGCASTGKLDIRAVGIQPSFPGQPVSARIALAHSQLALGNVALALEEFRRAERETPGSIVALAGMAESYRLMGRFDLTRRYYEQALAVAPEEPALYHAFAAALDSNGQADAAQALRNEVAARTADRAKPVVTASGSVARLPAPVIEAASTASVTVTLPPAQPIAPQAAAPDIERLASAPVTTAIAPARTEPTTRTARLERLSSGEVALVTAGQSPWTARRVAATPKSVTVRFEKREAMVVLNAARVAGIAARTRDYLAARGFNGASIGDAPQTRGQSLIRYPSLERARAQRIAAQFPFHTRLVPGEGPLTLIVGRDAAAAKVGSRG